jgi:hypothetical protein
MESNGKFVTKGGQRVNYQTGVRVFSIRHGQLLIQQLVCSRSSGVLPEPMGNTHSTSSCTKAPRWFPQTSSPPQRRTTRCVPLSTTAFYSPTSLRSPRRSHSAKPRNKSAAKSAPTQPRRSSRARSLRVIAPATASSSHSSHPRPSAP